VSDPGFRWDAEEYARNSAAQLGWARELIEKLGLSGHEQVLDLGCGDGKVTAEIARRVPRGRVVGVDSSGEMISLARSAFPPSTQPNLSFVPGDARALEFDREFDVIFSNATLHWLKDHGPVLEGAARSLRPGGRILFQMGGRGNGAGIFDVAREMIAAAEWRGFFTGFQFPWGFYGPEEYAPWCAAARLRVRRIELLPRIMLQKGAEGLAGWIRTTWMPYTERVPAERREAFVREASERYIRAHPPDAQGTVAVEMVRLEVDAVRDCRPARPTRPSSAVGG
jgi:trans-aconitate methyltransferase